MRVEINMRPYPEQVPPTDGNYTILYDIDEPDPVVTSMGWRDGKWVEDEDGRPIKDRCDHSEWVKGFALPEDITITEREV